MSIENILKDTETGITYGTILEGAQGYPVLYDSKDTVLSFPPIINGVDTKGGHLDEEPLHRRDLDRRKSWG